MRTHLWHELIVGASSGRGRCLENKPRARRFVMPAVLPGQFHDAAAQCRFQFGPSSARCINKTTVSLVNVMLRYIRVVSVTMPKIQ